MRLVTGFAWLATGFAWLATGFACRSTPTVRDDHAQPARSPSPLSPRDRMLALLPPLDALPVGTAGLETWLDEAAELLTLEPPPTTEPSSDQGAQSARRRVKIEASFETGLRWQDNLRLRAVELVGGLLGTLPSGGDPVLVRAVAALVLEDLAALGFDASGAYRAPSFDIAPDQMTTAMAQPEVVYSGLAASLYAGCETAAHDSQTQAWEHFCGRGRRSALVLSQALPACTHPSVSTPSRDAAHMVETPTRPQRAGLLLQGAFGVPLLQHELEALLGTAHAQLAAQTSLTVVPLEPPPRGADRPPTCAHAPPPSQRLVTQYPDTRWHGLYLQCEAQACSVQLCDDAGECLRAPVEGPTTRLASWAAAIQTLQPSRDSVLIESAQALVVEPPRVALEAVTGHGGFRDPGHIREAVAGLEDTLLACQVDHRYGGQWVLAVDRTGTVSDVRAQDDRYLLPLDQPATATQAPGTCIAKRLGELRFAKGRRGAPPRRVTLSLRIPARLQVEVPFVVRHDARVGPLSSPERLGRDGFAVAFARCAAQLQPGPDSLGMCVALSPQGQVAGVTLDPNPTARRRALDRVGQPVPEDTEDAQDAQDAEGALGVTGVRACIARALSQFEWRCRAGDAEPGHLALTVDLPQRLLARFAAD